MRRDGEGPGGFLSRPTRSENPNDSASTMLAGSTGIGLVLLSMLDDECDGWDAPLLTDL